jgi:hypothetical protein
LAILVKRLRYLRLYFLKGFWVIMIIFRKKLPPKCRCFRRSKRYKFFERVFGKRRFRLFYVKRATHKKKISKNRHNGESTHTTISKTRCKGESTHTTINKTRHMGESTLAALVNAARFHLSLRVPTGDIFAIALLIVG